MSQVRGLDRSDVHPTNGWLPPPTLPVCEPTQVLDRRKDRPWPFLYSYTSSGCVVNTAPRKSAYAQVQDIGEALI